MNPSVKLAQFVKRTSYDTIPANVIYRTKQIMLDTLSCAVAGYTMAKEECGWIVKLVKELGGRPEATVWFDGVKTSSMNAALANATMVHTVDFDDTHPDSVSHFGASLLATVIAAGEKVNASGKDILTAFVVGYEVAARVGNSVNKEGRLHYKYWHPTATIGTIGASAAAAKVMNLTREAIEQAIGLGVDQAAGFRYCIDKGDFSKSLHPGWAAMRGIMSAQIMTTGANGPKGLLEYSSGFCNATSSAPHMEELTKDLGKEFYIMQDAYKFYPTIHCSHTGIEATLGVVIKNDIKAEDVEAINLKISDLAKGQGMNYNPENPLAARLSIPYCVATAVLRRHVNLGDFTESDLHNSKLREIMSKIKIIPEPEFGIKYPKGFVAHLKLKTKSGKEYEDFIVYPKGHPDRPADDKEIADKYSYLTSLTWPAAKAEKVYDVMMNLEKVDVVSELTKNFV
jgi:2-methylcitrate dehydratase PrpD